MISKRGISGMEVPKKRTGLVFRETANTRDDQNRSRAGCSSAANPPAQQKSSEKVKTLRPSTQSSSSGKEVVGSSRRTPANPAKPVKEPRRTLSSSGHPAEEKGRESSNVVRAEVGKSGAVSNLRTQRNFNQRPGLRQRETESIGPVTQAVSSKYGLRNLRCNTMSDAIPSSCSSSDSTLNRRKTTVLKLRSSEGESSSTLKGKKMTGSSLERLNSGSRNGSSSSDTRGSRNIPPLRDNSRAFVRTERTVNGYARGRFSNQGNENSKENNGDNSRTSVRTETKISGYARGRFSNQGNENSKENNGDNSRTSVRTETKISGYARGRFSKQANENSKENNGDNSRTSVRTETKISGYARGRFSNQGNENSKENNGDNSRTSVRTETKISGYARGRFSKQANENSKENNGDNSRTSVRTETKISGYARGRFSKQANENSKENNGDNSRTSVRTETKISGYARGRFSKQANENSKENNGDNSRTSVRTETKISGYARGRFSKQANENSKENNGSRDVLPISPHSIDLNSPVTEEFRGVMPMSPEEYGTPHSLIIQDGSRYNMDGISEVLLALERMEQDEELSHEQIDLLETNSILDGLSFYDTHRDMRLDVDDMSYEELLALEERMGTVSTGLSEEALSDSLKKSVYESTLSDDAADCVDEDNDDIKCCICQEEYVVGDEIGRLQCSHKYHVDCVQEWLRLKNWCPMCKESATLSSSSSSSSSLSSH